MDGYIYIYIYVDGVSSLRGGLFLFYMPWFV